MDSNEIEYINLEDGALIKVLKNDTISLSIEFLILMSILHENENIKILAKNIISDKFKDLDQGFYEDAFKVFETINQFLPWMGDYKTLQFENYSKFNEIKERFLFLMVNSKFVEKYLDLGRKLFLMFGLTDSAYSCFEDIVINTKNNDEAYYALGRVCEKKKLYDRAFEYYEKCLIVNDSNLYALLQLGILNLTIKEDYEKAIELFEKVMEIEPFMVEPYEKAAKANLQLSNLKRAKQLIEIALGINEFHEESLNLLGLIQWKNENDIDAAINTFSKGLDHKTHGDSGILLASLAELYCEHLSDYSKAIAFYEKSLNANLNQPEVIKRYMVLQEKNFQNFDSMKNVYERYLNISDAEVDIFCDYAEFLIRYFEAFEYADRILDKAKIIDGNHKRINKLKHQIEDYIIDENFENDEDDFTGGGGYSDDN